MNFLDKYSPTGSGFSLEAYSSVDMPMFHQHSEIEIGFNETGTHDLCSATRTLHIPMRRLVVHWAMVPHRAVQTSQQFKVYNLTLPVPWFLSWQLPGDFTAAVMRGQLQFDSHPSRWRHDIRLFRQWYEEINSGNAELRKTALMGIELRLRHLALDACAQANPGKKPINESASDMSKVEQMASYIATHYHQNLGVAEVAQQVNLHEKYAMQLFKRTCSATILEFITQHRVWHAQRMLTSSDLTMTEISAASGFGSDNRFYALFKRVSGISPREYRLSSRASADLTF